MATDPHRTALLQYLRRESDQYYGKVLELREEVEGWLSYIPQTFPHYTRHTVRHSDEIIANISKLLFTDDDPDKCVVRLSATEAYILAAAAYLHDAGMVASDREKQRILESDEWKSWTTAERGGAKRWAEVEALRSGDAPEDDSLRHFLADLQTRFLMAEFIRRQHHRRAADVISEHQHALGRFAFDDPMLQRTVSDICVAHGLSQHELDDSDRFPDRRDVRGEKVNVRFLAILLRLGDLLDMTSDRACPLLLNPSCPMPADSLAHWTQYQRITHRLTAPDRVEITARCESQDEHRVLQDWCQWLVDEVKYARLSMPQSRRHQSWLPPEVSFEEPRKTIDIGPARNASYIPSKWIFELDHEAVFERLIRDVYDSPYSYIRELIQNALDATRCQMYVDLIADGRSPPEFPNQVEDDYCQRYPVYVTLDNRRIENQLSGEEETVQVLIVEDSGIGMDKDIIERYFLQVGRSYYTTEEFRRIYRFIPTSRFGVGFLSVFAVSDHVVIDTFKPSSSTEALCLTLTGPRNYLLTEEGRRATAGTRIEVLLREPMETNTFTDVVRNWCKRTEFPIVLNDVGGQITIEAEKPDQFIYDLPVVTDENARFVLHSYPIESFGVSGEVYVFAYVDANGESWARSEWAKYIYPDRSPLAIKPEIPGDLICVHGISVNQSRSQSTGPISVRLDYRRDVPEMPMSRYLRGGVGYMGTIWAYDSAIVACVIEVLRDHFETSSHAAGEDAWKYKQRVIENLPLVDLWRDFPEIIRVYEGGAPKLLALATIQGAVQFDTVMQCVHGQLVNFPDPRVTTEDDRMRDLSRNSDVMVIASIDLQYLADNCRSQMFMGRNVSGVTWVDESCMTIRWHLDKDGKPSTSGPGGTPFSVIDLPTTRTLGVRIEGGRYRHTSYVLLNRRHALLKWLDNIRACSDNRVHELAPGQFDRIESFIVHTVEKPREYMGRLTTFLQEWRQRHDLPKELRPPLTRIGPETFRMRTPGKPKGRRRRGGSRSMSARD